MKYYVIESSISEGQQANAITIKNTLDEALMLYHQIRASALANSKVTYNLTMIVDANGTAYACENHGNITEE